MNVMGAPELLGRLRRHYIKPGDAYAGGVFLNEVTHSMAGGRRADALYVGFTSTRGHHLTGFELKVSRSDWLHELDEVEKAEVWASQCHSWYAVAPDATIIRPEELPHGWGLMVAGASKTKMDVVVRAELHRDREPDWVTMHSILKRLDTVQVQGLAARRQEAQQIVSDTTHALGLPYPTNGNYLTPEHRELINETARKIARENPTRLLERAEKAEATVRDLCTILGIKKIGDNQYRSDEVTLDRIRTSFAQWLAVESKVDDALGWRRSKLANARKDLELTVKQLTDVEALLEHEVRAQTDGES